jgi:hypothetical protein
MDRHTATPPSRRPSMRLRSQAALVLCWLTLASAGCSASPEDEREPDQRAALRPEALGCWALYDGDGHAAEGKIDWAPTYVALLREDATSPVTGRRRAVRYDASWTPLPLGRERGIPGATTWSADSLSDTIRIGFNSALGGSVFVLGMADAAQTATTLYGRAFEFSDAGPPWSTPRGTVNATRVPCGMKSAPGV